VPLGWFITNCVCKLSRFCSGCPNAKRYRDFAWSFFSTMLALIQG